MAQQQLVIDAAPSVEPSRLSSKLLGSLFGTWSLLSSLLIFWVELLVAKMLLPRFGGSAAVWNTALVFFQVTLLAGYFFAHLLARHGGRYQRIIQLVVVVLPIATLPIALPASLDSGALAPSVAVVLALTVMVGAPFFALATSTPTLQTWFSRSDHRRATDPYFLYALSNVGSVIGLLGFPLVFERLLTIEAQRTAWAFGYGVFAIVTIAGIWVVRPHHRAAQIRVDRLPMARRIQWAAIAFVPSLALLGVTQHLSTDVAAFPLMWTVPLALYLASFVIAFREQHQRSTLIAARVLRVLVIPTALVAAMATGQLWLEVALPLVFLLALSVAAHGRVYERRPPVRSLTDFYLWVSIGGALGGLFATVVAPQVFDFVAEYPIAIILSAMFAGAPFRRASLSPFITGSVVVVAIALAAVFGGSNVKLLWLMLAAIVAVFWTEGAWVLVTALAALTLIPVVTNTEVLSAQRTFFGVYRVHDAGDYRFILSGTTSHGLQIFDDGEGQLQPTSYYSAAGPVGDLMQAFIEPPRDIGIIGLGIGGLLPYGGSDDGFIFYEIDPVVEDIARNEQFFTFVSGAEASVEVVIGDGRLEVEKRETTFDALIVDAFTSDAIPVHLLTLEAFRTYANSVGPNGKIIVHITNRHLDLEPVIGRIAEELGMSGRTRRYQRDSEDRFSSSTVWVILEKNNSLALSDDWIPIRSGEVLWTDDYSNVLSVIDWG